MNTNDDQSRVVDIVIYHKGKDKKVKLDHFSLLVTIGDQWKKFDNLAKMLLHQLYGGKVQIACVQIVICGLLEDPWWNNHVPDIPIERFQKRSGGRWWCIYPPREKKSELKTENLYDFFANQHNFRKAIRLIEKMHADKALLPLHEIVDVLTTHFRIEKKDASGIAVYHVIWKWCKMGFLERVKSDKEACYKLL